jgi:hypothetical protein
LPRLSRLELSDWPIQVRSDLEVPEPTIHTHTLARTHALVFTRSRTL